MALLTLSRVLTILMLINEAVVILRTPPEERARVRLPPLAPLMFVLLLVPFALALDLPAWLAALAVICQAGGLLMELVTETQLVRAQSFSILEDKGAQPLTSGFYRWFEHPIYLGLLLQMVGWSLWMPAVLIAVGLNYIAARRMVRSERDYLAKTMNFTHRGLDTPLWG